jgi:uncharacterized protein YerC
MTNISKRVLEPEEITYLMDQFYSTIASLSKKTTPHFFGDLLGEEEKIMFAKRLGAIILCIQGKSTYRIWTALHISPATAQKIRDQYKDGHYKNLENIYKKNHVEFQTFLDTLETIIKCDMFPRGKGRWKHVRRMLTQK